VSAVESRLTPGIIAAGLVIGTLYGPLGLLRGITPEQLGDAGYWREVAAAAIQSFAGSALAIGGLIAAALGLPLVREGRSSGTGKQP
jgi:hypothetical protein